MNPITQHEVLVSIERELSIVLKKDRKNWLKTALLLFKIESEELFKLKVRSFTQYVQYIANVNHVNVSTLWRAKTAAKTYLAISGQKSIEDLMKVGVTTTPEQLEFYKKVETIAPHNITFSLKEKILEGENIRHELRDIWKTYKPLKKGKTERGRKKRVQSILADPQAFSLLPHEQETESESLDYWADLAKMNKYDLSEEDVWVANIKNALRNKHWVNAIFEGEQMQRVHMFSDILLGNLGTRDLKKIDALIYSQHHYDIYPSNLLSGITASASEKSLANRKKHHYLSASLHYYFVAIPMEETLIDYAFDHLDLPIGILAIKDTAQNARHEIEVIRKAKFKNIDQQSRLQLYEIMLEQKLGWSKNNEY